MVDEDTGTTKSADEDPPSPRVDKQPETAPSQGRRKWVIGGALAVALLVSGLLLFSPRTQFVVGGGMVNLGYRMQDRLESYDLHHDETISPQQIWDELSRQNAISAGIRGLFPRSVRHPVVAIVACMDARIDTNELVGDTRRYYYIVRTAGSVMSTAEQEMLELAVLNGVKVILYTTHTDCAAEGAAASSEQRQKFPALIELMDHRDDRIHEFYQRPVIKEALEKGELLIKHARIDTDVDKLVLEGGRAH